MPWVPGRWKEASFFGHIWFGMMISIAGPVAPWTSCVPRDWMLSLLVSPAAWMCAAVGAGVLWEYTPWWISRLLPRKFELKVERKGWPEIPPDREVINAHLGGGMDLFLPGESPRQQYMLTFELKPCPDRRRPSLLDLVPFVLGAAAGLVFHWWRLKG